MCTYVTIRNCLLATSLLNDFEDQQGAARSKHSTAPSLIAPLSEIVNESKAKDGKKRKREDKEAKRAVDEEALREMRITAEDETKLENPLLLQKYQAAERMLMKSGLTKEKLDSLVALYTS